MPLFSMDDGFSGSGQRPAMYGQSAYRPRIRSSAPSRFSRRPVASVRFPPPLSPAMMIRLGSMPSLPLLAASHLTPDTQSLSPAGYGATSGADDGVSALR